MVRPIAFLQKLSPFLLDSGSAIRIHWPPQFIQMELLGRAPASVLVGRLLSSFSALGVLLSRRCRPLGWPVFGRKGVFGFVNQMDSSSYDREGQSLGFPTPP